MEAFVFIENAVGMMRKKDAKTRTPAAKQMK
jgi:hypothetical protein